MAVYTTTVSKETAENLKILLEKEGCSFSIPQYTLFQAKTKNWQITFYTSGKVVIQGKDVDYPVKKYFDSNHSNSSVETNGEIAPYPHIGIDESGKGDFFGPLVVAGCYLTKENADKLKEMGAADSKKLTDKKIIQLSDTIKQMSVFEIVVIGNKKYNELYSKFKNLNHLLGWGHATVLENILNKQECNISISDKFADEKVILNSLKEKSKQIKIIQQPRAEADTAVACASILARAEFVKRISKLSFDYGVNLPKGAGTNVIEQAKKIVETYGIEELKNISKIHFKTYENFSSPQKKLF